MKKFLPLLFALLASSTNAQLIECIDARGNSRYSETPCRPDERDPRKIHRRSSAERKAVTHDADYRNEQSRLEQKREAAVRAAAEEQRIRELIRIDQEMRYEAAAAVLKKLDAEKEAGR
ncbi:MAG: DUF4124 domain-containing protein [Pseudomonadota bacterium]